MIVVRALIVYEGIDGQDPQLFFPWKVKKVMLSKLYSTITLLINSLVTAFLVVQLVVMQMW